MFRLPYTLEELHFAYAYHLYVRCHTHRWQPSPAIPSLTQPALQGLLDRHDIRILNLQTDPRELVTVASLKLTDSVAGAVSKIKGTVSKWLREQTGSNAKKLLGEGYFACTSGNSTRDKVEAYLGRQGTHHGYAQRAIAPVYEKQFDCTDAVDDRLQPRHARALLRFHVVLASMHRKGVFGRESGPRIAETWQSLGAEAKFFVEKVSFVPDHVHMAVRLHPSVKPEAMVVGLLNSAETLMHREFPEHLIAMGAERLWQPSAYVGAYGDVTSGVVKKYIENWRGRG